MADLPTLKHPDDPTAPWYKVAETAYLNQEPTLLASVGQRDRDAIQGRAPASVPCLSIRFDLFAGHVGRPSVLAPLTALARLPMPRWESIIEPWLRAGWEWDWAREGTVRSGPRLEPTWLDAAREAVFPDHPVPYVSVNITDRTLRGYAMVVDPGLVRPWAINRVQELAELHAFRALAVPTKAGLYASEGAIGHEPTVFLNGGAPLKGSAPWSPPYVWEMNMNTLLLDCAWVGLPAGIRSRPEHPLGQRWLAPSTLSELLGVIA